MQKLLVFWSTKKQLERNIRGYKQSIAKLDLYSNSPNKHKEKKIRSAHRERGYKDTWDPRWSFNCINSILTWIILQKFSDLGTFLWFWQITFISGSISCSCSPAPVELPPSDLIFELKTSYKELKAICLQQTILKSKICFLAQQYPN